MYVCCHDNHVLFFGIFLRVSSVCVFMTLVYSLYEYCTRIFWF